MSESDITEDTFRERFWGFACSFTAQLRFMFVLAVIFLVLGGISWFITPRNSSSYFILQIDLIIIGVSLVGIRYALWRCDRHRRP